jgi:hypothetical protein
MACRATDPPFSSLRWASNAEASRTDAAVSLLATETLSFLGGLAIFSAGFRTWICDQLIGQAFSRRQVSEHASGPLYRRSTLNGGFIGFGGVCHGLRINPSGQALDIRAVMRSLVVLY